MVREVTRLGALLLASVVSVLAEAYPLTIEHKYGQIELSEQPQRVVSVGVTDHDDILALGVIPLAVRDWYGDQPYGVWPWAQDELGDAKPVLLKGQTVDFEAIAQLKPDLIIGVSSGMDKKTYDKLSTIAPTLAQSGAYTDWAMPWDERHLMIGKALGYEEKSQAIVQDIKQQIATLRAKHPEFEGKSAAVAFYYNKQPGAYASKDLRSQFLIALGFHIPESIDALAKEAFYTSFSEERMDLLDNDLVIWLTTEEQLERYSNAIFRKRMPFYKEKREYFTGDIIGGAFSFFSPLSIQYLIDEMVPAMANILEEKSS